MFRPSWDETWLGVAKVISRRSRCYRSGVGAVIVSPENFIVSTGYNGPPPALRASGDCRAWCPRARALTGAGTQDYSACESLHAEENALLRAAYRDTVGGTAYITRCPCINCARRLAGAGVSRVVFLQSEEDDPGRTAETTEYLVNKLSTAVVQWEL